MRYIMNENETGDPELHIEIRRESLVLADDYCPWRLPEAPAGTQHVFVYGGEHRFFPVGANGEPLSDAVKMRDSGSVEVSKIWLAKLLKFFDDPENRERCGVVVE